MSASDHVPRQVAEAVDEAVVTAALSRSLRSTLFSSGLRIAPSRIQQVAVDTTGVLFQFLRSPSEDAVRSYGRHMANEGLGLGSLLGLSMALRTVLWDCEKILDARPLPSDRFVDALIEGYVIGREENLLREQERTRRALVNAMHGQS